MLKYPHLFSPVKVGNVIFRNRICESAMGWLHIKDDHTMGDVAAEYYARRAKGGAAEVCVGECHIDIPRGTRGGVHMDLFNRNTLADLANIADKIKRQGAVASAELVHYGRFATAGLAPSDGVASGRQNRAYTTEEIEEILDAFAKGALNAKMKGFDMVTIHGAHGWLPQQFFSEYTNSRTDEWGGTREKRARFAVEICDRIHALCGRNFPVEFRISGTELSQGYGLEEGVEYAKALDGHADIIHVSAGVHGDLSNDEWLLGTPGIFDEESPLIKYAAAIKKEMKHSLVGTVGGHADPAVLEEIIASGKADVIYMGRALLADPFLPNKVMANEDDKIVRCLRCFVCMSERATTSTRRCTVNPLIGREIEGDEVKPAPIKKKVLVAGAGPGGLYAAYTAARRGHQVILCEKSDACGGILKSEQALPFKYDMYRLAGTYEKLAREAGVRIKLNTEVTAAYVEKEAPDALIIAAGSTPIVPPIPGLNGPNVVVVNNYYKEEDKVGDEVVVIGAGLAGCECAVHLGMLGKKVNLVEMRDVMAPDANIRHRPLLMEQIAKYANVFLEHKALRVTEEGVWCENKDGEEVLVPGPSVICAMGQRGNFKVVEELQDTAPFVRVIGDASRVSNICNAVYWGYHAALDI